MNPTTLGSPLHPLWAFLRLSVYMITLCFILWLNATKFDETEVYTLVSMFGVLATGEGGFQLFRLFKGS